MDRLALYTTNLVESSLFATRIIPHTIKRLCVLHDTERNAQMLLSHDRLYRLKADDDDDYDDNDIDELDYTDAL